jgi:flagellar basal body P-ring formation protein FlgA
MSIDRVTPHQARCRILPWLAASVLATATLVAAGSEIEPVEHILETARTFLTESLDADQHAETQIEIGRLDSRLRLAHCDEPLTAQFAPGSRAQGSTTVNIRCSIPVAWSVFVPARVERYSQVVIASKPLARLQVLQPNDVRLERTETSKLASGYFEDPAAIMGMRARRAVTAGQVLTPHHVTQQMLVERGQQVTLFSAKPGLTVRMSGEALEDGVAGQRIRVRNRSSKRIVEGYIEPSGAVRVAL